jgi:hypothetical protein
MTVRGTTPVRGKDRGERSVLSVAESIQVHRWIENNKVRVERERLSRAEVAAQAEAALGFRVSAANVANLGALVGVLWSHPFSGGSTKMADIERRLAGLEAEYARLLNAVNLLCDQLGVPEAPKPGANGRMAP